ncbi:hypothetical protein WICMUC_001861 [Wickerhamomyces mucosus]|uniref:Uncharacterized protein n=1 Tax=Wickerhamomyces mucosus TaxID=1378264 RepID=A0A9P8TG33_9ASCO|nr:hypothetical protein WICMUC_001861 [Wickerhamomyces mucosus]
MVSPFRVLFLPFMEVDLPPPVGAGVVDSSSLNAASTSERSFIVISGIKGNKVNDFFCIAIACALRKCLGSEL